MTPPLKGEFLLQIPPLPAQDPQKNSGFSLEHHHHHGKRRRRSKSQDAAGEEEEDVERSSDGFKQRKIMHRDIERHRRQEMAGLYSSLRSLLPVEYIRGKRSISDHMFEAVNYIKNTEKRIEELCRRRDNLKKLRTSAEQQQSVRKDTAAPFTVNVNNSGAGIEAVICCGSGVPLSGILIELVGAGLSVVSSVSTRIDEKFIHVLQAEVVSDKDALASSPAVDTESLQRRLEKTLAFA